MTTPALSSRRIGAAPLERRRVRQHSKERRVVPNASVDDVVVLDWQRFPTLTSARAGFPSQPCVYMQAESRGIPVRVGMASQGLEARYRGGTGYALDAAMHCSGNLVFVTPVPVDICEAVEKELIWQGRGVLIYNNVGRNAPPTRRFTLRHTGTAPSFDGFQA